MSQFKPGDPVRVVSHETSLFAGVQGVVDEVEANKRNLTQLDSYTVRFSWGEKQIFWGAQLESVVTLRAALTKSTSARAIKQT